MMNEISSNSHSVEIDKISVRYGHTVPVRNLSLLLNPGELVSILGPSGCGKTTTLRVVAGFVTPFEGDVRIDGVSVMNVPANHRNIGMMYQSYALFPHMTVAENVAFGLRMRGVDKPEQKRRVEDILEKLHLRTMSDRQPAQLSGGQQQRVALARALVINPNVLLLDEPLAALDKKLRAEMQFELKRIQKEFSITTMFVSHDQEEALSLSDRIAVMNDGKILQLGTPEEIYDRPVDRFVGDFIGNANFFKGIVTGTSSVDVEIAIDALGKSIVCKDSQVKEGNVDLLVRPERVRVEPQQVGGQREEDFAGRVLSKVFLGNVCKLQIEMEGGHIVHAEVSPETENQFADGVAVHVSWDPANMRIFPGK